MKAKLYERIISINNVNEYLALDEECSFRIDTKGKLAPSIKKIASILIIVLFIVFYYIIISKPKWLTDMQGSNSYRLALMGFFVIFLGVAMVYCLYKGLKGILIKTKSKYCTYPIEAKIIIIEDHLISKRRRATPDHHYYPVFHYYYEGKHYIARSDDRCYKMNVSNHNMYLGQPEMILINPDDPYSCRPQDDIDYSNAKIVGNLLCFVILAVAFGLLTFGLMNSSF